MTISTHPTDDDLVLNRYEPDLSVAGHLESCDACAARARDLDALLSGLEGLPVPDRGEGYGRAVWRRVEPRLSRSWFRLPELRWLPGVFRAFALAAVIAFTFLLGRWSRPGPQPLPAAVRERILLAAIGQHLDRSERVLLSLQALPQADAEEISRERERASRLVQSSRLYRQTATRAGDPETARQLEVIERLLLLIAREPLPSTPEDRAEGIEASPEALFRVRVLATHLRQRASRI